ncbi:hypothetical protein DM02DRAFT_367364 [Periconia macrospinosa]|uniref:Uncharacterized protein n=1 Tax=Periconia macrospinosa TaxID=97972 RepID=A0A2V1DW86_9PLEO|nr:hypothetical protein DM02DRAFT_367364 [Periconia macrospinosa]
MRYQLASMAAVLVGFTMMQTCPAPVGAVIGFIASIVGSVGKVIVNELSKRDFDDGGFEYEFTLGTMEPDSASLDKRATCMPTPNGVPENVIQNCCNSLRGARIVVTGSGPGSVQAKGVPFPCISAAPWIDGVGAVPFACGDTCLQWNGLSQSEYNRLKSTLRQVLG